METKKRKHKTEAIELGLPRDDAREQALPFIPLYPLQQFPDPADSIDPTPIAPFDPSDLSSMSKKQLIVSKLQRQRSECVQTHLPQSLGTADEEYQRIIITETSEDTEPDTIYSCQTLHRCMSLRKKWICDLDAVSVTNKEIVIGSSLTTIEEGNNEEMSDLPPPLPLSCQNMLQRQPSLATQAYSSHMVEGVMHVFDTTTSERLFIIPSFADFVQDYLTVSPHSLPFPPFLTPSSVSLSLSGQIKCLLWSYQIIFTKTSPTPSFSL
jgi:hypothetical protein